MIQKLFFAGLLFVACVGLPGSIYLSKSNQRAITHVFAEQVMTPTPSPKVTDDANGDYLLNILDYNILLNYKDQTTLTHFIREIRSQTEN